MKKKFAIRKTFVLLHSTNTNEMTKQPTMQQFKDLESEMRYAFYNSKNQYLFLRSKKMLAFRKKWDKMALCFNVDYTIEDVLC